MTREEAIKFANCLKNNYTIDFDDMGVFCDMAIKALEMVEEFEKAQIISSGRLNGRTYAYKCGLEDGKHKALKQEEYYKDLAQSYEKTIVKLTEAIAEQQPSEDGMEKHTDRQIYDGCIHLMQKMVDYFQEYLEYLGYDLDLLDEDERFAVGISNMEIVRWLFLFHTRNSGGCSTRDFCEKIGIDDSEVVKFEFERDEV